MSQNSTCKVFQNFSTYILLVIYYIPSNWHQGLNAVELVSMLPGRTLDVVVEIIFSGTYSSNKIQSKLIAKVRSEFKSALTFYLSESLSLCQNSQSFINYTHNLESGVL